MPISGLIFKAKLAYQSPMRSGPMQRLRRFVSSLMLVAMAAFVQQAAMITLSQAAASLGSMPQPAVVLLGLVHLHDNLAANVHAHGSDHAVGHVHSYSDHDDHDSDDIGKTPFLSLGSTTAFLQGAGPWQAPLTIASTIEYLPQNLLDGIEPDGLSRPPSIPSIA